MSKSLFSTAFLLSYDFDLVSFTDSTDLVLTILLGSLRDDLDADFCILITSFLDSLGLLEEICDSVFFILDGLWLFYFFESVLMLLVIFAASLGTDVLFPPFFGSSFFSTI
jgi:hypothetical protein